MNYIHLCTRCPSNRYDKVRHSANNISHRLRL